MNKQLIQSLKDSNQDFEFYPTTFEIINIISKDFKEEYRFSKTLSILDIGAGNGNFFNILEEIEKEKKDHYQRFNFQKYAIEKSSILIQNMKSDIFVIGTDFNQQCLIDKKVDIIFCNPPYSEYIEWAEKAIKEANCEFLYLVIPERWKNQPILINALKARGIDYEIIGTSDFLEAERQARAKIDIIKIKLKAYANDPFSIWFDSIFTMQKPEEESISKTEAKLKSNIHEMVKGSNLIDRLEELYNRDLEHLLNTYKKIEELDGSLLKELGVSITGLKEGLKSKIKGLKNLYWRELFDNLDTITNRLTKSSRDKMFSKLMENTTIEFTAENAYSIVIWIIKNSNEYIDNQLKDVYYWMTRKENIINYKSNKRLIDDTWRYNRENHSHYTLDYRLIFQCYSNFGGYVFERINGLSNGTAEHINDLITIGINLGFSVNERVSDFSWESGKKINFTYGDNQEFMEIKAYKNGNIHCKANQEFMMKLNIEAGRLNNWIRSPKEASEEIGIPLEQVEKYYKKNYQLSLANAQNLLTM